MNQPHPDAERIVHALVQALEPLSYTQAMWQGGAAAFNRLDPWSDIDIMIDVDDDFVEETLQVVERTLESLAAIDLKYEIPQPSWHGHAQTIYRLEGISPFMLVDLAVLKHSSNNKFLEPEIHGNAVVLFDKSGVIPQASHFDAQGHAKMLEGRVETLRVLFDLLQVLTLKELKRGNSIEALAYYYSFTLRPLVELLRIKHTPNRYNFHTRYLYYELSEEVVRRLERLFFIGEVSALEAARVEAEAWFRALLAEGK